MQPNWFSSDDQTNFLNNVQQLKSLINKPANHTNQRLMVFSHVPKTGGTTLEHILAKNFRLSEVLHINAPDLNNCPEVLRLKKKPPKLICGHHPMHGLLYGLLPDQPLTHITMLRNPLDRVLSFYNYILGKQDHPLHARCQSLSLEAFLQQQPTPELSNGQTRRFSGTLHQQNPDDEGSLDIAKDVLNQCFTDVWVTEHFDQALLLLQHKYGFEDVFSQRSNVSVKRVSRHDLSAATVELILDMNQEDVHLHEWAKERCEAAFHERFSEEDLTDFHQRLSAWQTLVGFRGRQDA